MLFAKDNSVSTLDYSFASEFSNNISLKTKKLALKNFILKQNFLKAGKPVELLNGENNNARFDKQILRNCQLRLGGEKYVFVLVLLVKDFFSAKNHAIDSNNKISIPFLHRAKSTAKKYGAFSRKNYLITK